jgi:translocator protein
MELATRSELRWALVRAMAVIATLVVVFAAITSKFGADGRALWFAGLRKPAGMLSPEGFTLWWALMFLLLGLALAIVWQARGATYRRLALIALGALLLLGLLWSPFTFGWRQLAAGAGVGIAMGVIGLAASLFSFRVRKFAGALTLLVAGWAIFCAYAGTQLWQLNGASMVVTSAKDPNMAGQTTSFGTP